MIFYSAASAAVIMCALFGSFGLGFYYGFRTDKSRSDR